MKSILTEIIRKECEAYPLFMMDFLLSVEDGVDVVYPYALEIYAGKWESEESFLSWRKDVLLYLYQSNGFTDAVSRIEEEYKSQPAFFYDLKNRRLRIYRERYKGKTIDQDLAVSPHTVAFKLSTLLANEQHTEEVKALKALRTPGEIEQYYQQRCAACFPLDLEAFVGRLKAEDKVFIDELLRLIRKIAGQLMSYLSISLQYKAEVLQDTWSDTCLFINEKVRNDNLPPLESSLHFRHYIGNVCHKKACEARRTNYPKETVGLDETFWEQYKEVCPQEETSYVRLEEIDPENKDEVNQALAVILLDRIEPWFGRLTAGIEKKTTLLLSYYADGKSYETMAREEKGLLLGKIKIRWENNLRQTVSRTRRQLRQRFVELLKKEQK